MAKFAFDAREIEDDYVATKRGEIRLSREERDYVAGHALDSLHREADNLSAFTVQGPGDVLDEACSNAARKIAALSNLLSDIGWERVIGTLDPEDEEVAAWTLGELFPVAQLRPWLEEWQCQDNEALVEAERALEATELEKGRLETGPMISIRRREEGDHRQAIADAQTKLGTGAILLARGSKSGWPLMKTRLSLMGRIAVEPDEIRRLIREELEMAWLRGYFTLAQGPLSKSEIEQAAADYAERVVRGSTRPERPEVER